MLSAADEAVVARDDRIPALGTLLDVDAIGEEMTRQYPEASIVRVTPRYLRYKRGNSCLAAYSVETPAGALHVYARAHNPSMNDKADRAADLDDTMSILGGGVRVASLASLVFFPFPNDHELPALRALGAPDTRQAMLRDAMPSEVGLWDGELEIIRYKPERRCVGRLRGTHGLGAALKFYRRDDYEAVRDMTDVFDDMAPLRVPRRIARSKRYRCSAVEWLDAPTLWDALAGHHGGAHAYGIVGQALARLHGQKSSKLRVTQTAESYVAALRGAASAVAELTPELANTAESLAERLAGKLLKRHWRTRRAIHGDLSAEQILLLPDAAAVVDFDRASYGDPRIDLGTFAARLAYDVATGAMDGATAAACEAGVMDAYRSASDKDITRKVDRFTAASLIFMAVEPFRHRLPEWPSRIESILARAAELVSGDRAGAA